MKKVFIIFAIMALAASAAYASDVRVRFYSKYEIKDAVIYSLADKNMKGRLKLSSGIIEADYNGKKREKGSAVSLFNGTYAEYTVETAGQARVVPGRINAYILPDEKGIVLVSTMDIEDYVPCVLASELDTVLYKPELAKAFAIVIRTFAKNKRHDNYDFCDLTHCEVFKGVPTSASPDFARSAKSPSPTGGEGLLMMKRNSMWYKPVTATKGMVLSGACVKEAVYFSACCGGVTENAGEFVKGKADKCGLSKPDALNGKNLCEGHRYFKWIKHLNTGQVERALASFVNEKSPEVKDVKIASRTSSGRVKTLEFIYVSGGIERRALLDVNKYFSVFGKQAGWALVPSKWFDIRKEGNGFVLNGRGHGHGVGLCLQGASNLAAMGKTYREILAFYFPQMAIR
jgi:stage II sporulation protein D